MIAPLGLDWAYHGVQILLGWSLLIQSVEYLALSQQPQAFSDTGLWRWSLQAREMPMKANWALSALGWLFEPDQLKALFALRALCALVLMIGGFVAAALGVMMGVVMGVVMFVLMASTVLLLFRFRGAFNGGSDFMTLVVVSGLFFSELFTPWVGETMAHHASLGYIALHSLSSYFVSGWVKLKRPEWRSGEALVIFLDAGIYGPLPRESVFRQPWIAGLCSWSFMLWEAMSPVILISPLWAVLYCCVAGVFHFLVFWYFGLNRFFWAWMVTFPALVYCSTGLLALG
jgi:hypothetical protein